MVTPVRYGSASPAPFRPWWTLPSAGDLGGAGGGGKDLEPSLDYPKGLIPHSTLALLQCILPEATQMFFKISRSSRITQLFYHSE